jgi:hypothetical protein
MKQGRPSIYSDELAQEILERYTNGELMIDICNDEKMPTVATIYDWNDAKSTRFKKSFSECFSIAKIKLSHVNNELSYKVLTDLEKKIESGLLDYQSYPALSKLACKKSDIHARYAGLMNKAYNDAMLLAESRNADKDITSNVEVEI